MKGAKPEIVEAPDALADVHAPAWFSENAQAEWDRVMPILTERRILTDADLGNLENYCVAIGMVREFEREFQATSDTDVRLKLFRAMDKAMGTARQLGAELGLTPVSRSRPAVRETEDADDAPNPLDQ
ncbi:phage terminase small subunit P27 family [Salipiger thiooxidans]|uniref:phage terminase small subunit P27 family n=1 Tax=Salipiger thiooxidans TaxID=282683 RepID=UPI001CD55C12|nr:phage terminase small subunit P27 family [Salipiger thiooxidans]MCA0847192.1 phage terminase small subunit P27 family [Salipiger thiooxidans]